MQKNIKRKEYMLYALAEYNRWCEAKEKAAQRRLQGENVPEPQKKPIWKIREEWIKRTGLSIYI